MNRIRDYSQSAGRCTHLGLHICLGAFNPPLGMNDGCERLVGVSRS